MLLFAVILPLWVVFVLLTFGCTWVRMNISPSLPYGLYRIHEVPTPLRRGMLVVVEVRGWSPSRMPFLKPVAAVAGEWVCRVGRALVIHGEDYGPVYDAWRGTSLPSAVPEDRCLVVPPGHVFLATPVPQSLDSRYYGPVAIDQITATATPLLTLGSAHASTHP
jgi:type IV secretory pathway protease TraF